MFFTNEHNMNNTAHQNELHNHTQNEEKKQTKQQPSTENIRLHRLTVSTVLNNIAAIMTITVLCERSHRVENDGRSR